MPAKPMSKPETVEATIVAIKKDQTSLFNQVQTLSVTNEEEMTAASEVLSQVHARVKRIEAKRIEYVKPLNDQVSKINADFKAAAKPYVEMESTIKQKIGNYVDEQRRLAAIEQRRLDDERRKEAQRLAAQEDISQRKAMAQIEKPVVEAPVTAVKTETAKVVTKLVAKFEITDPSAVPEEYKMVDERLVRKAVLAGARKIAGVKIWEESQVSAY